MTDDAFMNAYLSMHPASRPRRRRDPALRTAQDILATVVERHYAKLTAAERDAIGYLCQVLSEIEEGRR